MIEFKPGEQPIETDNEYCVDTKVGGKVVSDSAWMQQKVRDAIIAMALHHCDTDDYEILGVGIAALGNKLRRMMEKPEV